MTVRILQGDCREVLRTLPAASVHCIVTSPPYWGLRDYGVAGQLGLESTPAEYVEKMVAVFSDVRRVLRDDGTLWLNLGDSYASIGHKKSHSGFGTTGLAGGIAQEHSPTRRENNGDGLKHKDLCGIPWRVAFALQSDGWYLRQDIIWSKPNPMPESVRDRCTKAHEYLFLFAKRERYYFDADAIAEPLADASLARLEQPNLEQQAGSDRVPNKTNGPMKAVGKKQYHRSQAGGGTNIDGHSGDYKPDGTPFEYLLTGKRNKRSVWNVTTQPFKEAHFATFPPALIEPCILAGCPVGGTVLDPFGGAGTTGLVADRHGRNAILIELNPEYADMARKRIVSDGPLFAEVA